MPVILDAISDGVSTIPLLLVLEIKRALKRGLLRGYYVMAEQVGGELGAPDSYTPAAAQKPKPKFLSELRR